VVCDVDVLGSLPAEELRSGLAEVAKYGFIARPSINQLLVDRIEDVMEARPDVMIELVSECAAVKAAIVGQDERETFWSGSVAHSAPSAIQNGGGREVLNYGHTFGHAIEATSSYRGVRHGEAVSLGMMIAANLAELIGMADTGLVEAHEDTLRTVGLPVAARLDGEALEAAWQRDKKYQAGARFVLLERVGSPVTGVRADREDVMEAIRRIAT
jgi:3-dehydroquinate synthase